MAYKVGFVGFRHGHILGFYDYAKNSEEFVITAACEEDEATHKAMIEKGYDIAYDNYDKMLNSAEIDIIAVGDYFTNRGQIIIKALEHGKHILTDKPICSSMDELETITALVKQSGLQIGCQLDMRDTAPFQGLKKYINEGLLGEPRVIMFGGQHPLLLGSRASWYFEPGKHGGTINDIAIHGMDMAEWLTGLKFTEITAARSWNSAAKEYPWLHDSGQLMAVLSNGCGVIADVSYVMPDAKGYTLEQYWRMTIFGEKGMLETNYNAKSITYTPMGGDTVQLELPEPNTFGYVKDFLKTLRGEKADLTSENVLRISRVTLTAQITADEGLNRVNLD